MTFHILTIFPEVLKPYLKESVLGRAVKKGLIKVKFYDLRDFTDDKHNKVDDKAYGGGPGMVIKVEPLVKAMQHILKGRSKKSVKVLVTEPSGKIFDNKMATNLSKGPKHIVIIAGRYEGLDERFIKVLSSKTGFGVNVEQVSTGPYVLTGGELPAMAIVDAVSRHIKGVLGKELSLEEKRLGVGVPAYTRPEVFKHKGRSYSVPSDLISGDHEKIKKWRGKHRRTN
ncbi:tRNA (guanosine(37)-N1)-methyltransferase TrmD [Patescibacteria group bacterium]|nr:tRNA (guanosine(37)-N1)-methyltransferase TrmD [Patescibacteria group bacterium]